MRLFCFSFSFICRSTDFPHVLPGFTGFFSFLFFLLRLTPKQASPTWPHFFLLSRLHFSARPLHVHPFFFSVSLPPATFPHPLPRRRIRFFPQSRPAIALVTPLRNHRITGGRRETETFWSPHGSPLCVSLSLSLSLSLSPIFLLLPLFFCRFIYFFALNANWLDPGDGSGRGAAGRRRCARPQVKKKRKKKKKNRFEGMEKWKTQKNRSMVRPVAPQKSRKSVLGIEANGYRTNPKYEKISSTILQWQYISS